MSHKFIVTKRFDSDVIHGTEDLSGAVTYAAAAVMHYGTALEVLQVLARPPHRKLVSVCPEHIDWRLASADTILTTKALACGLWPAIDGPSPLRPKFTTIEVEVPE